MYHFDTLPDGSRHVALDSVVSTNIVALDIANSGEKGPIWVTAQEQTGGRGSRGRGWVSKRGNLYSSLMFESDCKPADAPTLAFAISLGLHAAITRLSPKNELKLKWPNDVLLEGRKVSGILLERHRINERDLFIVGMGINCAHHPSQTNHAATDLAEHGIDVTPETLFSVLTQEMAGIIKHWDHGSGFSQIRKLWLDYACGVGERITARTINQEKSGIFLDIDQDGQLVLLADNGIREKISVADIFFAHG